MMTLSNQEYARFKKQLMIFLIALAILCAIPWYIIHVPKRQDKPQDLIWTEKVRLQSGKMIIVRRRISGEPHPDYSHNRYALAHDIEVIDTAGLGAPPPAWSHIWSINIIDQDENGVWFLVVHPRHCEDWNSFYKFRQYKAINGQWQQVEFEIDKLDGRKPNLSFWVSANMYDKDFEMREFISFADKAEETGNARLLTEKYIIRRNIRGNYCDTPCIRDEQGQMHCGWWALCPPELSHDEQRQCIDYYKDTMFTPSFMRK